MIHIFVAEDLQEVETSREGMAGDYILPVSKVEYDNTPSWLRDLASWEARILYNLFLLLDSGPRLPFCNSYHMHCFLLLWYKKNAFDLYC